MVGVGAGTLALGSCGLSPSGAGNTRSTNMSMMPHPMHLHGHFFQVDNGTGRGPLKDTVLVDPMQQLTINWISDNPGLWAFHCHNAYHQGAGMMRVVDVK